MAEKLTPGRIALLYAVTGCLWILFSDQLVALLFRDPRTNLLISEFKGWGFIFVTALLLFWLIRDSREQLVHSEAELRRKNLVLAENREKLLRYELLAGNSRDIILFLRRDDGRIMEANAAAMITYGYDHQELLAMTIQELRAADAASETSTLMDVADAHGLLFETVHRRKDGSTFPVEVSSQGATIGDTRMLISVIRDITQRREMERSLRLWADAFESCAHGMAIGNPATNTILTCNPAFAQLHRQKVEEIVGVPILSLYAQDEHDQVRQRIAEVNQTGTLCFESVMQRRDGSRFPVQVDAVNVRAADGQLLHRIVTVQDITERRQTMELLEKSRLNLLTILDNLPFMAWLKDTEGRFIAVNRPFADSCCHTDPEQLVGKTDLDVYPEHLALSYRADDQDVMASRQKKALEEIVSYHGVEKWFETFKAPLFDLDGRVIGTTGVSRDITEQKAAEEAVRASEQRWRQLAEAMPQLVWTCTPDGACDYLSTQWLDYTGIDEADQLGTGWLQQVHPHDRPILGAAWDHAVQSESFFDTEFRIRRHDGAYRWFKTRALPVRDETGRVVKWYGSNTDIHELREAQQTLLDIEEQHRLALAATRLGTWRHDLQTDLVHLDQLARHHYASDEALISLDELLDRVHPNDADRLRDEIDVFLGPGQTDSHMATEYRLILPDGTQRWLQVHVSIQITDIDGERIPRYVIGTCQDITERKQLEEQTAHLASFPQLNPSPVLEADISGRIVYCNTAALKVLQADAMGGADAARFLPADLDLILAEWDKTSEAVHQREVAIGERVFGESIFLAPQFKLVRIYAYEITGRKRAEAALQRAHDELERRIAERTAELAGALESLKAETAERLRTVEELREKERLLMHQSRLAALGEMVGNIAHQWRQPLNSLALLIQHAKHLYDSGRMTDEEAAEASEQAMSVISHMSQTIDDFRNFFRPDKEKVEFPVHEAVTKAVALVEDSLRELQITVEVNCEGKPRANGYPNEYSQVLLNILLNARDAFAENRCRDPRITITSCATNGRTVVTVADNAGGIPPAIIEHIFEPYFSTKGVQGTGIGLYMAKTIIEKSLQGSLTARNTGNGAEFRIEI